LNLTGSTFGYLLRGFGAHRHGEMVSMRGEKGGGFRSFGLVLLK